MKRKAFETNSAWGLKRPTRPDTERKRTIFVLYRDNSRSFGATEAWPSVQEKREEPGQPLFKPCENVDKTTCVTYNQVYLHRKTKGHLHILWHSQPSSYLKLSLFFFWRVMMKRKFIIIQHQKCAHCIVYGMHHWLEPWPVSTLYLSRPALYSLPTSLWPLRWTSPGSFPPSEADVTSKASSEDGDTRTEAAGAGPDMICLSLCKRARFYALEAGRGLVSMVTWWQIPQSRLRH